MLRKKGKRYIVGTLTRAKHRRTAVLPEIRINLWPTMLYLTW